MVLLDKIEDTKWGNQKRDTKWGNQKRDTKWGNQKLKIKEGQTIQWLKDKGQKDKQRSTKHYTEN